MKIYTKTGDDGTTGLIGGKRVSKSDDRIECIGSVDELNAAIGWAQVAADGELSKKLRAVQNELFVIGAQLARPEPVEGARVEPVNDPPLPANAISRLESEIDAAEKQLSPLKNFILPGGCESSARLHLARTICRRAERILVKFFESQPELPIAITYLNRLSDWLFVQARLANRLSGTEDIPWVP
jgi:cob(I)alamin adenosyltransferase